MRAFNLFIREGMFNNYSNGVYISTASFLIAYCLHTSIHQPKGNLGIYSLTFTSLRSVTVGLGEGLVEELFYVIVFCFCHSVSPPCYYVFPLSFLVFMSFCLKIIMSFCLKTLPLQV